MAINDYEGSRDRGQQVELYQFIYGEAGQEYLYTDGEGDITFDGKTYTPLSIDRDKITSKGDLSGREIKVKVPISSEIANLFRIFPPGRVVNLIIRQGHVANPDDPVEFATGDNFGVIWTGRVLESSRAGSEATLTCEALSSGMKRPGLTRHYQWSCPLALYGTGVGQCNAPKVANPAVVSTIVGNKITLVDGWIGAFAGKDFIGGLFEWQGVSGTEARGILRVESTNTIVISGPPIGLAVTDSVDVFLGCPHTLAGCETLHDNVVRYGGEPWIPTAGNPVGRNTHF